MQATPIFCFCTEDFALRIQYSTIFAACMSFFFCASEMLTGTGHTTTLYTQEQPDPCMLKWQTQYIGMRLTQCFLYTSL